MVWKKSRHHLLKNVQICVQLILLAVYLNIHPLKQSVNFTRIVIQIHVFLLMILFFVKAVSAYIIYIIFSLKDKYFEFCSTLLIFAYLILAVICRVPGECTNATFLAVIPAYDLSHCMKICQVYEGCYYGTFNNLKKLCLLYETCSRAHVKTAPCPDCLTSSLDCYGQESGECKFYMYTMTPMAAPI